jgi:hypothetical protein
LLDDMRRVFAERLEREHAEMEECIAILQRVLAEMESRK